MAEANEPAKEAAAGADKAAVAAEVGRVSYEALKSASAMVKPGVRLIDVAEHAEGFLKQKGFGIAFPLNISVNEQAAHYTPSLGDEKLFGDKDVVKLDFGAEKDGILGDCALTIDLSGNNGKLLEAAQAALSDAIATVRAGVKVRDIGAAIAKAIEKRGLKPIRNLGGHGVGEHELHSSVFVPNYDNGDDTEITDGMTIAIEPFATDGRGMVSDGDFYEIYDYIGEFSVRSPAARKVLSEIEAKYPHDPFAVRWLAGSAQSKFGLYAAVRELLAADAIRAYPVLVELGNGLVSQFESELLVEKDGCRVLTGPA